jgi:hypothetical protein
LKPSGDLFTSLTLGFDRIKGKPVMLSGEAIPVAAIKQQQWNNVRHDEYVGVMCSFLFFSFILKNIESVTRSPQVGCSQKVGQQGLSMALWVNEKESDGLNDSLGSRLTRSETRVTDDSSNS